MNDPLFFLHIPKTGGTTLRSIIERPYEINALFSVYDDSPSHNSMSDLDSLTLSASDEENIRRLNAGELAVYRQVCEHFKQRTALTELGHPFVRGMIGGVSREAVVGWAVFDNTDEPVTIEVLIDGNFIGTSKAKDYRPHLCQIGVHRGGYVGFNLKVPRLKAGDSIECRVAQTGQSLIGSPRLVTEKDVGNK